MDLGEPTTHDVFICHASEDKAPVVRPLAEKLVSLGLQVWYDEWEMQIGDSLRRRIDAGLAHSRFGVVVLSSSFFGKEWPQWELDGLAAREMSGPDVVILPVWHGVDEGDVARYSPSLAGKFAARWEQGIDSVAEQIARRCRGARELSVVPTAPVISGEERAFASVATVFPRLMYAVQRGSDQPALIFRCAWLYRANQPALPIEPVTRQRLDEALASSNRIPSLAGAEWRRPEGSFQNSVSASRTVDCERGWHANCWLGMPSPQSDAVKVVVDFCLPTEAHLSLEEMCRAMASVYATARDVGDRVVPTLADPAPRPVKIELHVDAQGSSIDNMVDLSPLGDAFNPGFVQGIWSKHPSAIDDVRVLDLVVSILRGSSLDWGFENPDPGIAVLRVELGLPSET